MKSPLGEERRIEVSRVLEASAARVFEFLANPANHPQLDTSGMVRSSASQVPITAVGDVFVMNMRNQMKGDHQVENHVIVFERCRAIGWAPAEPGRKPAGHTWVWRMTPVIEGRTSVSHIYDWSEFTPREMLPYLPVLNRDQLQTSLDRLAQALA
jgi:uncharacterized protein YndB with AHSA1/START domain